MTMPSAHQPPSPPHAMSRRVAPEGIRAVSGLVAGVVGGAIGAAIAITLAKNDTVLDAEINVQYLAIFGSYGAALGAVLLAVNAARREYSSVTGSFLVGAILGGAAGGLGATALMRAFVEPVLRRGDDPKPAYMLAVALILGALGLCLGLAVGLTRGAHALVTALSAAVVGAAGGAAYVQYVLFSERIDNQSDFDTAAMVCLAATGAAIGLVIGAFGYGRKQTPVYGDAHSGIWKPIGAPPVAPVPVTPQAYPRVDAPTAPRAWTPTSVAAPTPAPPPVPTPTPAPPQAAPKPAAPAPPAPTPPVSLAPSRFALRFDDGRTFEITERLIVGRDPQRSQGDDGCAALVSIDDAAHTVSPTHFAIVYKDDRLFAEDRGSSTGSAVVSPSGVQTPLSHNGPVRIGEGWTVLFGACRGHIART